MLVRLARALGEGPAEAAIGAAWGGMFQVSPRETIGKSLWQTGIYDLTVSEVLWRLTPRGGVAVDVGANLGYTSVLLAKRVGDAGRVVAYEPNEELSDRLHGNLVRNQVADRVELRGCALSERPGTGRFIVPESAEANEGLGRLAEGDDQGMGKTVELSSIDHDFPTDDIDVLKIDVEGHEAAVLRGAERSLREGRTRHVVFEEHEGPTSETCQLLQSWGYELRQLGWSLPGPVMERLGGPRLCKTYEPPSYLATRDLAAATKAMNAPGWVTLKHHED